MRAYDTRHFVNETEWLLYDILQELKRIKSHSDTVQDEPKKEPDVKQIECKYCKGTHSNKGEFLACSRKHKKKG